MLFSLQAIWLVLFPSPVSLGTFGVCVCVFTVLIKAKILEEKKKTRTPVIIYQGTIISRMLHRFIWSCPQCISPGACQSCNSEYTQCYFPQLKSGVGCIVYFFPVIWGFYHHFRSSCTFLNRTARFKSRRCGHFSTKPPPRSRHSPVRMFNSEKMSRFHLLEGFLENLLTP